MPVCAGIGARPPCACVCVCVMADAGHYSTMHEFYKDVMLVWDNAIRYNAKDNIVHQRATEFKKKFYDEFSQVLNDWKKEVDRQKANPENCSLCGGGSELHFEQPAIFCQGQNCGVRIKRGSNFYSNPNKKYHVRAPPLVCLWMACCLCVCVCRYPVCRVHVLASGVCVCVSVQWCSACFKLLKKDAPVIVEGKEIPYSCIQRDKNTDQLPEPWVECDGCHRWQHQICALFNQRRHEANSTGRKYYCPMCLLKAMERAAEPVPQPVLKNAALLDQVRACVCVCVCVYSRVCVCIHGCECVCRRP